MKNNWVQNIYESYKAKNAMLMLDLDTNKPLQNDVVFGIPIVYVKDIDFDTLNKQDQENDSKMKAALIQLEEQKIEVDGILPTSFIKYVVDRLPYYQFTEFRNGNFVSGADLSSSDNLLPHLKKVDYIKYCYWLFFVGFSINYLLSESPVSLTVIILTLVSLYVVSLLFRSYLRHYLMPQLYWPNKNDTGFGRNKMIQIEFENLNGAGVENLQNLKKSNYKPIVLARREQLIVKPESATNIIYKIQKIFTREHPLFCIKMGDVTAIISQHPYPKFAKDFESILDQYLQEKKAKII